LGRKIGEEPDPAPQGGSIPGKRYVKWLLVAGLVAVGWLAWSKWSGAGFDWQRFSATFTSLDRPKAALGVGLGLLTYLGRAIRWQLMIRPIAPAAGLWRLFTATAIGFTAVVLLGRPGEFVRPYLIAARERVPVASQMAAWLLERIFDLLIVLLIFGVALLRLGAMGFESQHSGLAWVLRSGGTAAILIFLFHVALLAAIRLVPDPAGRINRALAFLPVEMQLRLAPLVRSFIEGMACLKRVRDAALLTLYTAAEWGLILGSYYFLFGAFGPTAQLGFLDMTIVVGFVTFGTVVQIPGVGGGMQVVTVLVLTEIFSVAAEHALAMAVLLWIVTYIVIVPLGLYWAVREGLSLRQLSRPPVPGPSQGEEA